jgi:hypothetical protein
MKINTRLEAGKFCVYIISLLYDFFTAKYKISNQFFLLKGEPVLLKTGSITKAVSDEVVIFTYPPPRHF